jgi:hypothetical protein
MAVDILSIAPPAEHTETVPFGGGEITIHGLRLAQIARIAQRYDAFRKVYFNTKEELDAAGLDVDYRAAAMIEAYPAIIVAGTRKDGAKDARLIEAHIERFPQDEITRTARAILRLTNGEPEPEPGKEPEKKDEAAPESGASPNSSPPSNT